METYFKGGQVNFLRSRRGLLTIGGLLVLGLFLIRPGADRLRTRIVHSISLALGRQVDVASVTLQLLPRPGFELVNFVVHDDAAFSAEPMLRADQVTASLRVSSLLRGRIEIARLTLSEPSLNLVRNSEGHWNLEGLLERAAKTPIAPTSKARTEVRPGFPYIEADRGRINFKFGMEKKPYALTDADFGLWQDSENAWGMRLKAQPVRTDFNLSDTGLLTVDGTWQRAAALRVTPLQFNLLWERAQLGQASKLVYGNDKGWRGTIEFVATLRGTPGNLLIGTEASVADFRRYDIPGGGALRLAAQCTGHYSTADQILSKLACRAPVGDGVVTVDGSISGLPGAANYDLAAVVQHVPMQSLAVLARRTKKNIPMDLVATGKLEANGNYVKTANAGPGVWTGSGEALGLHLSSKFTKTDLLMDKVPFAISAKATALPPMKMTAFPAHAGIAQAPSETRLEVGPFNLALGRPSPAVTRGWISYAGYGLALQGEGQVQRLLQFARTIGVPAPAIFADGAARFDLQVAGNWPGFKAPSTTGRVQVHSIRTPVAGLNTALEIASADLSLEPDEIKIRNVTASLAGSIWHGSLVVPRLCAVPGHCAIHFDLHADEVSTDQFAQILNAQSRQRAWYQFTSSSSPAIPYLRTLHAVGRLAADRMLIHKLVATGVSANTELEDGKLRLSDLRGNVLGGRHTGEWKADFTVKPPKYVGSGSLEHAVLAQLADAMHDGWVSGMATARYEAAASGWNVPDLLASANASLQIDVQDARLPHIVLGSATAPLQVQRFTGRFLIRGGRLEIQNGKIETAGGNYQMSGTASFSRDLDMTLSREGGHGFNITGTLTEPHVSRVAAPETRAALKP
jgi:AsmA family/AsmA-like C-terminal region